MLALFLAARSSHHSLNLIMQDTHSFSATMTGFELLHPRCAGLDLSSTFHVSYLPSHLLLPGEEANRLNGGRCEPHQGHTTGLIALKDYLLAHGVTSVILECTGVFWFGVYEVLTKAGLEVCAINPAHASTIAGRKTDENDAEWLCRLHTYGLLRASFVPSDEVWALRSLSRHRQQLIEDRSSYVLRCQKELDAMNIKLHKQISNIMKGNGRGVLDFIAQGVPADGTDWLAFYNPRFKCDEEEFVLALKGSYSSHRCLLLKHHLATYDHLTEMIDEAARQIEIELYALEEQLDPQQIRQQRQGETEFIRPLLNKRTGKKRTKGRSVNEPLFELNDYLQSMLGVDPATIPGIGEQSVLQLVAELGVDLKARFTTSAHFCSWLQLAPNQKISAGKVIGHGRTTNAGQAHQIFRDCAYGLSHDKGPLGQKLRSLKIRKSSVKAYKALAHKLAKLYYQVVTTQQPYDENKLRRPQDDERKRQRQIDKLERQLSQLKEDALAA